MKTVLMAGQPAMGADFSADRRYRYLLWRRWDTDLPPLGFVMLNPSSGGDKNDDPTIRICCGRARLLGYGGIMIGNLYGWVATDPDALRTAAAAIGRDNDEHLQRLRCCADIVLAWGVHAHPARAAAVLALLRAQSARLWHLGLTKSGMPRHPLRVPYATPLMEYRS